jgi:hypothetical protein
VVGLFVQSYCIFEILGSNCHLNVAARASRVSIKAVLKGLKIMNWYSTLLEGSRKTYYNKLQDSF